MAHTIPPFWQDILSSGRPMTQEEQVTWQWAQSVGPYGGAADYYPYDPESGRFSLPMYNAPTVPDPFSGGPEADPGLGYKPGWSIQPLLFPGEEQSSGSFAGSLGMDSFLGQALMGPLTSLDDATRAAQAGSVGGVIEELADITNTVNPSLEAFGKPLPQSVKSILPALGAAVGTAIYPVAGTALGSGIGTHLAGGSSDDAVKGAGLSAIAAYAGGIAKDLASTGSGWQPYIDPALSDLGETTGVGWQPYVDPTLSDLGETDIAQEIVDAAPWEDAENPLYGQEIDDLPLIDEVDSGVSTPTEELAQEIVGYDPTPTPTPEPPGNDWLTIDPETGKATIDITGGLPQPDVPIPNPYEPDLGNIPLVIPDATPTVPEPVWESTTEPPTTVEEELPTPTDTESGANDPLPETETSDLKASDIAKILSKLLQGQKASQDFSSQYALSLQQQPKSSSQVWFPGVTPREFKPYVPQLPWETKPAGTGTAQEILKRAIPGGQGIGVPNLNVANELARSILSNRR